MKTILGIFSGAIAVVLYVLLAVSAGISSILTVAFIVMKVAGVISWAWVFVLSPLWIVLAALILLCILAAITYALLND